MRENNKIKAGGAAGDRKSFLQRTWPRAAVGLGLALTAIWVCVLAYGFYELVEELVH